MHSSHTAQGSSYRRSSEPVSAPRNRRVSEPAMPSSASSTFSLSQSSAVPGTNTPTTPQALAASSSDVQRYPLVMPPVSQLPRSPRRHSRADAPLGDRPATYDQEYYNPDGSVRTVHKLPGFEQSYAQALSARVTLLLGLSLIRKEETKREHDGRQLRTYNHHIHLTITSIWAEIWEEMDCERTESTACMQSGSISEYSPNCLRVCKTRKYDPRRKMSKSPTDQTRCSFEERQSVSKRHCPSVRRPAPRVSESDMCLEDVRRRNRKDVSNVVLLDSDVKVGGHGRHNPFGYESRISSSQRLCNSGTSSKTLDIQEELMKKGQISANMFVPSDLQPEMWSKVKETYILSPTIDVGVKKEKDRAGFEHFYEDRQGIGEFFNAKSRTPPRKLFTVCEHSRSDLESKTAQEDTAGKLRAKNKRSLLDNSRNFFGLNSTLTDKRYTAGQSKYSGLSDRLFGASDVQRLDMFDLQRDICATYSETCRKNRRARTSNKKHGESQLNMENLRYIHHDENAFLKRQSGKHHQYDPWVVPSKVLASDMAESNYRHRNISEEIPKENKNFSYSQHVVEPADVAHNLVSDRKHIWEQTIVEESSAGTDNVKECCSYGNATFHQDYENENPSVVFSSPTRLSSQKKSRRSSAKQVPYHSHTCHENKYANKVCKWKNDLQPCDTDRQEELKNCESSTEEARVHEMARIRIPEEDAIADSTAVITDDDIISPLWTCTRWRSDIVKEDIHEESEPQWAYEVYSNTSLRSPSTHTTSGSKNNTFSGHDEDSSTHGAMNLTLLQESKGKSASRSRRFCVKTYAPLQRDPFIIRKDFTSTFSSERGQRKVSDSREAGQSWKENKPDGEESRGLRNTWTTDSEMPGRSREDTGEWVRIPVRRQTRRQEVVHVKQKRLNDRNMQAESTSQERDSSSHNAEQVYMSDEVFNGPDHAAKVIENIGISYFPETKETNKLTASPDIIASVKNSNPCKSESSSVRQTPSSVDEKLMRTVHAIKEDIQSVLERLNSLEMDGDHRVFQAALSLKENMENIFNSAAPDGTGNTITNVNCATDFVRSAFRKLISFRNSFGTDNSEEEESSTHSYEVYKKGKDEYLTTFRHADSAYEIEVISTPNTSPREAPVRAGEETSENGMRTGEHFNSDTLAGEDNVSSVKPSSRSSRSDIPSLESDESSALRKDGFGSNYLPADFSIPPDTRSHEKSNKRFTRLTRAENSVSTSSLGSVLVNTSNKRGENKKVNNYVQECVSRERKRRPISPPKPKASETNTPTVINAVTRKQIIPLQRVDKPTFPDGTDACVQGTTIKSGKDKMVRTTPRKRNRKISSNAGAKLNHNDRVRNKSPKGNFPSASGPKRPARKNERIRHSSQTDSTETSEMSLNRRDMKSKQTANVPKLIFRTPTQIDRKTQKFQQEEETVPTQRCCRHIVLRSNANKGKRRSSPLSKALGNVCVSSRTTSRTPTPKEGLTPRSVSKTPKDKTPTPKSSRTDSIETPKSDENMAPRSAGKMPVKDKMPKTPTPKSSRVDSVETPQSNENMAPRSAGKMSVKDKMPKTPTPKSSRVDSVETPQSNENMAPRSAGKMPVKDKMPKTPTPKSSRVDSVETPQSNENMAPRSAGKMPVKDKMPKTPTPKSSRVDSVETPQSNENMAPRSAGKMSVKDKMPKTPTPKSSRVDSVETPQSNENMAPRSAGKMPVKDKMPKTPTPKSSRVDSVETTKSNKNVAPRSTGKMPVKDKMPQTPAPQGSGGSSPEHRLRKVKSNNKATHEDSRRDLSETEMYITKYGVVGDDDREKKQHSPKSQVTPPRIPDPGVPSQSPRQKGKWLRLKKRRSKSRARNRKKRSYPADSYGSNTSRMSSSDTSVFSKIQGKKEEAKDIKRPTETRVTTFPSKTEGAEPFQNPENRRSPKPKAPKPGAEIRAPGQTDAHSGTSKPRGVSTATGKMPMHEVDFDSVIACTDKAACSLDESCEHAISKRTSKSDTVKKIQDDHTSSTHDLLTGVSKSELHVSIQRLYEEINKLRMQLEMSTDDLKTHPFPVIGHQEKCCIVHGKANKTALQLEKNSTKTPKESPTLSTYSRKKCNLCPGSGNNLAKCCAEEPDNCSYIQDKVKSLASDFALKLSETSKESPAMDGYNFKKGSSFCLDNMKTDISCGRESARIQCCQNATTVSYEPIDVTRGNTTDSPKEETHRGYGKTYSEQLPEHGIDAKILIDALPSSFLDHVPVELSDDSQAAKSCIRGLPVCSYCSDTAARESQLNAGGYWPNEDIYVTATCNTSDNTDTQFDATEKFETAASDSCDFSSHFDAYNPSEGGAKANHSDTGNTFEFVPGERNRPEQIPHRSPSQHAKLEAVKKSMPVSGMKINRFFVSDSTDSHFNVEKLNVVEQDSVNNNMRPSDELWPDFLAYRQGQQAQAIRNSPREVRQWSSSTGEDISSGDFEKGSNKSGEMSGNVAATNSKKCDDIRELFCNMCTHFRSGEPATELSAGVKKQWTPEPSNTNPDQWPLESRPFSENVSFQIHEPPLQQLEKPYTDEDLFSADKAPFVVKCVRDVLFGSGRPTATDISASSHKTYECASALKPSPTAFSKSQQSKTSTTGVPVSSSEVDEICKEGYVRSRKEERTFYKPEQSDADVVNAPLITNYISKKRETSDLQSSSQQFKNNTKTFSSAGDKENNGKITSYQEEQWTTQEIVISGLNQKDVSLTSHSTLGHRLQPRSDKRYASTIPHMRETDSVMKHYSDAISGKSRKRFPGDNVGRLTGSPVIKTQDYNSERSSTDLSENEKVKYDGVKRHTRQEKSPSSPKPHSDHKNESLRSPHRGSDCFSKKDSPTPFVRKPASDENALIASFESMMQQRRPCYVEHCGFRQKKRETAVIDRCVYGESNKDDFTIAQGISDNERQHVSGITVANDNNSSIDVKLTEASIPEYVYEGVNNGIGSVRDNTSSKFSGTKRDENCLNLELKEEDPARDSSSENLIEFAPGSKTNAMKHNKGTDDDNDHDDDHGGDHDNDGDDDEYDDNDDDNDNEEEDYDGSENNKDSEENAITCYNEDPPLESQVEVGGETDEDENTVEGGAICENDGSYGNQQRSKNSSTDTDERESWYRTTDEESDMCFAVDACIDEIKEKEEEEEGKDYGEEEEEVEDLDTTHERTPEDNVD